MRLCHHLYNYIPFFLDLYIYRSLLILVLVPTAFMCDQKAAGKGLPNILRWGCGTGECKACCELASDTR